MDDQTAFLVGILPAADIAKISAATNVPAAVVVDAMAFEKRWTDAGIPAGQDAMGARTALGQAALVLHFGMSVPPKLIADYLLAAIEETRALNAKYGAANDGAANDDAANDDAAGGQEELPPEDEVDGDGDDEKDHEEDAAEVDGGAPAK